MHVKYSRLNIMSLQVSDIAEAISNYDLRYVSDAIEGIKRERRGKKFVYLNYSGDPIYDSFVVERINNLAIPPAWEQVWICPFSYGHLQATGLDAKGRKQYIYHEQWKKISEQHKFNRLTIFGELLPKIRSQVNIDMQLRGLKRSKILATIVWLLEHTFIRVGNEEYAKDNNSYGLTTLRNKHTKVEKDKVTFAFKGKSGVYHTVDIRNPLVTKILKQCIELPGYELFQYVDGKDHKSVDSADVNGYLQIITGEEITAKDFRTWGATVLTARTLHKMGPFETEKHAQDNICEAVKKVANHLRNTPSVCRSYYIHPAIIEIYQKNMLLDYLTKHLSLEQNRPKGLSGEEYTILCLLKKYNSQGFSATSATLASKQSESRTAFL